MARSPTITIKRTPALHTGNVTHELFRTGRTEQVDLLVAGAYGRSQLSELVFGGVVRDLLRESPVCYPSSHLLAQGSQKGLRHGNAS